MIFKRKSSKEDLEKKVEKWLSPDEKIEESVHEQLKLHRYQFLVVTGHRAILFESDLYGRLQDKSDKLWRQLISTHLKQGMKFSALDVYFFQHHDTSQFHNPYQNQEPFEKICWHLTGLNQEQAGKVYANLKGKERAWAGERIVIVLEGKPYLELVPYRKEEKRRRPGRFKGKIRISDDFTETPDDIVRSFYGEDK